MVIWSGISLSPFVIVFSPPQGTGSYTLRIPLLYIFLNPKVETIYKKGKGVGI